MVKCQEQWHQAGPRVRAEPFAAARRDCASAAYHHPPIPPHRPHPQVAMGFYSTYYSFGLLTFIVVVVALYLLFTGAFSFMQVEAT